MRKYVSETLLSSELSTIFSLIVSNKTELVMFHALLPRKQPLTHNLVQIATLTI